MRRCGLDPAGSGQEQMAGSCEHGNKLWVSVQFENLISTSGHISCTRRNVLPGILVSQSVSLTVCLSVSQSVYLPASASPSLSLSHSLSLSLTHTLSFSLFKENDPPDPGARVVQLRFGTWKRISPTCMKFEYRKQPNQQPVDSQQKSLRLSWERARVLCKRLNNVSKFEILLLFVLSEGWADLTHNGSLRR